MCVCVAFDLFQMPIYKHYFVEFFHSAFPDGIMQQYNITSL